jgi:hypothetical protein
MAAAASVVRRAFPSGRGPERLLVAVGISVGLLIALLYPPWSGGADEPTHFARALEMAHGRIMPEERDGVVGSWIPTGYRDDQESVVVVLYTAGPFDGAAFDQIRDTRPDWSETFFVDTQPTLAATPVAYAPSAVAMAIPDRLGWAGVWVLWTGRIANLLVYLAVAWVAVRLATAFRWTLAITALFPMNLGIAASVTPDALTISAFLLVIAVWTRVWRPGVDPALEAGTDPERHAVDEAARSRQEALAALTAVGPAGSTAQHGAAPGPGAAEASTDETAPVDRGVTPTRPGPLARLDRWTRTPWGTFAMVLAAGLLLVATKPPYFLVLVAFPALLLTAWRDVRLRMAALASVIALAAGGLVALVTSSGSYKAVTLTFNGVIEYQPDVQRDRILADPFGFLGRVGSDWFGNLDHTVQRWVRHIGYVEVTMPAWLSWAFVIAVVVAAAVLDRRDLLALRRWSRAIWALLCAGMILALYVSSYLYFDDTEEGIRMGLQIPRYVSPFLAMGILGWFPRFPFLLGRQVRVPTWIPVGAVVVVQAVFIAYAVHTWSVAGWSLDTS